MPWYDFLTSDNDTFTSDGGRAQSPSEMTRRLRTLIPPGWASRDKATLLTAVLGGLSDVLYWIRERVGYARLQTRIRTATGFWLDLIAWDFFGPRFMRRRGETDAGFEPRIVAEIFRPRATREAVAQALTDLTGRAPILTELWNTADVGAYGTTTLAYAGGIPVAPRVVGYDGSIGGYGRGRIGYGVRSQLAGTSAGAGRYGSLSFPNQVFITAYRSQRPTIKQHSGYGAPRGGYGVGRLAYASLSEIESSVPDAEILSCVADTVAEGITAWVRISD